MKKVIIKVRELLIEFFLLPVKIYRKFLSPLKGQGVCRFRPTCSQYCIEAVREWGIIIGSALTVWRILRCNPWSQGGDDPVPKRKSEDSTKNNY